MFQNQFDRYLNLAVGAWTIPRKLTITGAEAAGAYEVIGTFPDSVVEAYRYIYADALRIVWYVCTGIAGLGLLVSLWVRNESLDRGNKSKQTFKNEEKKVAAGMCRPFGSEKGYRCIREIEIAFKGFLF